MNEQRKCLVGRDDDYGWAIGLVVFMFMIFPAKCSLAVAMFRTTLHIAMRMDLSSLLTRLHLISLLWTLKIKLI